MSRPIKLFAFFILLSASFALTVCSKTKEAVVPQSSAANSDAIQAQRREDEAASRTYDHLGKVILTVDFKLRPSKNDSENGQNDLVPWVSVEKPEAELSRMMAVDEIVIPFKTARMLIDYPLNKPAYFDLIAEQNGFSRRQLVTEISKKYHNLYVEEEATASQKTIPLELRNGTINRNETDGKYGIWGHDLSDLGLSTVEVRKDSTGAIILVLVINS